MALPAPGLTLKDKQAITRALLHSGANIKEMNLVRRHLSAVKGGKLARMAQPARIVSLIISDVPGITRQMWHQVLLSPMTVRRLMRFGYFSATVFRPRNLFINC